MIKSIKKIGQRKTEKKVNTKTMRKLLYALSKRDIKKGNINIKKKTEGLGSRYKASNVLML